MERGEVVQRIVRAITSDEADNVVPAAGVRQLAAAQAGRSLLRPIDEERGSKLPHSVAIFGVARDLGAEGARRSCLVPPGPQVPRSRSG